MHIVFGILSSINTDVAVQQLIDSIGTKHTIIVHHDFSKQPEFHLTGNNVHIINDYVLTQWGDWSLVEAAIKLLDYAINNIANWDYFQLLSDSCLPIQPITNFENYLATVQPDANISCIALAKHPDIFLSHGYRAFSSKQSNGHKFLRKIRHWSNKLRGINGSRMVGGLTIPIHKHDDNLWIQFITHYLQGLLLKFAMQSPIFDHPFHGETECFTGSQFFGCSKSVCQQIKVWMSEHQSVVKAIEEKISIPDEFFFQTIIGNLRLQHCEEAIHLINFFDSSTFHGTEFQLKDLEHLKASGKFFGRKFSKNPNDAMRLRVIKEINE